jgi:hypothetical protein
LLLCPKSGDRILLERDMLVSFICCMTFLTRREPFLLDLESSDRTSMTIDRILLTKIVVLLISCVALLTWSGHLLLHPEPIKCRRFVGQIIGEETP